MLPELNANMQVCVQLELQSDRVFIPKTDTMVQLYMHWPWYTSVNCIKAMRALIQALYEGAIMKPSRY